MANFCNKCGKPAKTNARFCPHCGARLSQGSGQSHSHPANGIYDKNKRERVMKNEGGGMPRYVMVIFGAAIVAVIGVLLSSILSSPTNSAIESQPVVSNDISYSNTGLQMVDVSSKVANGKITLPLDLVKKNEFVAFRYTDGSRTVPLLAYIAPDGKLVTAVSLCEPCRSTRFHIVGDNIVCNTCGTTWKLQNLEAVSGACGTYPPQIIPSRVVGNKIQIDVKTVSNWQPRA